MEHTDKKRKVTPASSPTSPTNGKSDEQILFAVPKKGRLHEKCLEFLKGAGMDYTRTPRLDIAQCNELPVTLVFLPAADIAQYVGEGNVDMGITGKDIIGETGVDVVTLMSLEFGKCKLAVQTPIGKYKSAAELAGQRVVTSFPNLARKYFDKFDTSEKKTSIKYVSGSVEVACGLGLADGIVDLVETGTTMKAAGLEAIETVMETETVLISNPKTTHQKLVKLIQKRLEGYLHAIKYYLMTYNIEKINFDKAKEIAPGHESPTVSALKDEAWISVSVMVKVKESSKVMDQLYSVGARSILCLPLSNCRVH